MEHRYAIPKGSGNYFRLVTHAGSSEICDIYAFLSSETGQYALFSGQGLAPYCTPQNPVPQRRSDSPWATSDNSPAESDWHCAAQSSFLSFASAMCPIRSRVGTGSAARESSLCQAATLKPSPGRWPTGFSTQSASPSTINCNPRAPTFKACSQPVTLYSTCCMRANILIPL